MHPNPPTKISASHAFTVLDRALRETFSVRKFGKNEMNQVLDFFGKNPPECTFCGSLDVRRWDHLVPVKSGGETVLGNLVPACATCDDAKRDLPYDEFLRKDRLWERRKIRAEEREARILTLQKYIEAFHYKPVKLLDRLTTDEQAQLQSIQTKINDLRQEFQALANQYTARLDQLQAQKDTPAKKYGANGVIVFDHNEAEYFNWLKQNSLGYVINTGRSRPAFYVVMHRATCNKVTTYFGKAKSGAFTERGCFKVCANEIDKLEKWTTDYNQPEGTRIMYCDLCKP